MQAQSSRLAGTLALAVGLAATLLGIGPAAAAEAPVGLGTAASFAVLAGSTVTNTGPSVISGDLGVSPGTAVTGFPPGTVNNGTIHAADAVAAQAQLDVTTAYNDAAGRSATAVAAELGGRTLVSGVYSSPTLGLTGTVTLDGQGDPNAVFVFQAGSTLITGTSSVVALINGAQACKVYWKVGSSATLGTGSSFVGTVLALTSITANTNATVRGRLLARNGAVTLDTNSVTRPACASESTTTTSAPTTTTTTRSTTTTTTAGTTPTVTDGASGSATGGGAAPSTPGAATPDGGTTGGAVPTLPATGQGLSAMTLAGLVAVALGAAALQASRRPARR